MRLSSREERDRDAFERDSAAVCLSEDLYTNINVITGQLAPLLSCLPSQPSTQGSPCGPSGTSSHSVGLVFTFLHLSSPLSPSSPLKFQPQNPGVPNQCGPISTGILKDYLRELPTPLITQPPLSGGARGRWPGLSRAPSSTEAPVSSSAARCGEGELGLGGGQDRE